MKSTLTIWSRSDLSCFAVGDVLSTGDVVMSVDLKGFRLICRPNTRLWRTVAATKAAPRRILRWLKWQFWRVIDKF